MSAQKYKAFANRLIEAMKLKGYTASRSPSGICMKTLAQFVDASEQICRRYVRGDALPDYEKILLLSEHLDISPGWLLFGEEKHLGAQNPLATNDDLLHYILKKSHYLYKEEIGSTDDYADFVLELVRDVRDIDTSKENLEKIIDLAVSSISSYTEKRSRAVA